MVRTVEIWSGPLTQAQMETEVGRIAAVFRAEGWDRLIATKGTDVDRDGPEPETTTLSLVHLRGFVTQNLSAGLFRRRQKRVLLRSVNDALQFVFTSRREIGFTTGNLSLASDIEADWKAKGYRCYEIDRHTWYQISPTGRFYME